MAGLPPINPPGASLQRGPDGGWYADSGSAKYKRKKKPRRRPLGQQPPGIKQTNTGIDTAYGSRQRN